MAKTKQSPPWIEKHSLRLRVTMTALEKLADLCKATGLNKGQVVDLLLRGGDPHDIRVVVEAQLDRDAGALAAWEDAGG